MFAYLVSVLGSIYSLKDISGRFEFELFRNLFLPILSLMWPLLFVKQLIFLISFFYY